MRLTMAITLLMISSGVLYAQAPPIKMGLWEKNITMTGGPGGSNAMKAKSCVTPETWQHMMTNAMKEPAGCSFNRTKTANGYSYTGSCSFHGTTMTLKGSATIQDAEHIVSESHTTTNTGGSSQQMDSRGESHFLSSDCGSVKPGSPQIER